MPADLTLVDRIVRGVLSQLGQPNAADAAPVPSASSLPSLPSTKPSPSAADNRQGRSPPISAPAAGEVAAVSFDNGVLTAELLLERVQSGQQILIGPRTILTPSAQDLIRAKRIQVQRRGAAAATNVIAGVAVVCKNPPALDRLLTESATSWKRLLSGKTTEGVERVVNGLSRGEFGQAVLFVGDPAFAACQANRHSGLFAATLQSAGEVKRLQAQMPVNCWCIDPGESSLFELKNLLRICAAKP